ncbi:hypothetical protein L596_001636 [Steinernema carpocapsae]|uniref:Uncharacterized protein n=1 Tax=Steinernema carpocapsae TaxID=34508 RepID=A0A4U8UMT7_STECR|nr:hypothetical protein L596_001636 [Steinernema carpocapsae]
MHDPESSNVLDNMRSKKSLANSRNSKKAQEAGQEIAEAVGGRIRRLDRRLSAFYRRIYWFGAWGGRKGRAQNRLASL